MKPTIKMIPWVLGLSLLFLLSCQEKEKKQEDANENPPGMQKVAEPDGIISLNEAKELCDNYETRRIPSIKAFEMTQNESEEFVPTQFIDFDFKTIHNYLKYVKQQAQKAGVKPDSIRIYLGNYGKEGRDPNRNTVFLLPTANINGENGGFYIGDDGKAKLIRNYWPKDENGNKDGKSKASLVPSFSIVPIQGNGSLIMNRGQSGPPPHNDF